MIVIHIVPFDKNYVAGKLAADNAQIISAKGRDYIITFIYSNRESFQCIELQKRMKRCTKSTV